MHTSRRKFLQSSCAVGLGFGHLASFSEAKARREPRAANGYGPLQTDPDGLLALPDGFTYHAFSAVGETMDDGFFVPGLHDGMAAFPGPEGRTVLVRNHELAAGAGGAFGANNELLAKVEDRYCYDRGYGKLPCLGGTTTIVYDTVNHQVDAHYLSLAGTARNCARGATPWGTWISCEESVFVKNDSFERDHGFAFEVDPRVERLTEPVPLEAMGRFNREAVAVDPESGVVYQTEDTADSLFYRFVPDEPGKLSAGGQLQALAIADAPSLDTRNWHRFSSVAVGEPLPVRWIDLDEPLSPNNDLRHRGFVRGAARFARGEGLAYGDGAIYFCATAGGSNQRGQIWRYTPSSREGRVGEKGKPGTLELFLEPNHHRLMDMCDNVAVAPWGDLVVCEDGPQEDRLLMVTQKGDVFPIARHSTASEIAGACFSPDGSTLFANIQGIGVTVAIQGPWQG